MWLIRLQLVILYSVTIVYTLPIISSSRDQTQAVNYLRELGYIPEVREDEHADHSAALPSALQQFQLMARLPASGELDGRTIEMMNKPRCGVKDLVNEQSRRKRYAHSGSKWNSNILQWRVSEFSSHFSHIQVIELLKSAFNEWSAVTTLYFEYKPTGTVDIEVKFTSGSHNDGYRFDGSGGILAHAFFPPQADDYMNETAGDLHFDDDEQWSINIHSDGENLLQVAIHEIGHSLGLQHSSAVGSVMWPWSKGSAGSHIKLAYDDVLAIQTLYGGTKHRYQRDVNELCQRPVDAIFEAIDGNIYLFTGNTVLQLDNETFRRVGQARSISSVFDGVSSGATVNGAISPLFSLWPDKKNSYLFIGSLCYRYSLRGGRIVLDSGYPSYTSSRWNTGHMTLADTVFSYRSKSRMFFVKGNQYGISTGTTAGFYPGYPRGVQEHRVLSQLSALRAAFLHRNGTNYYFTTQSQVFAQAPNSNQVTRVC